MAVLRASCLVNSSGSERGPILAVRRVSGATISASGRVENVVEAGRIFPDVGLDIDPDAGHLVAASLGKADLRTRDEQHDVIAIHAFKGTKQQQFGAVIATGDLDIVL